mmetsp:Transcript_20428/g.36635  ORF Transcript_20428/g.36635 Transcript_20428/m.36635 type:complete len:128 (-) Transcript_20428:961-1344(-)
MLTSKIMHLAESNSLVLLTVKPSQKVTMQFCSRKLRDLSSELRDDLQADGKGVGFCIHHLSEIPVPLVLRKAADHVLLEVPAERTTHFLPLGIPSATANTNPEGELGTLVMVRIRFALDLYKTLTSR